MRLRFQQITLLILGLACWGNVAMAASTGAGESYDRGRITQIVSPDITSPDSSNTVQVKLLSGTQTGQSVWAGITGLNSSSDISLPSYKVGDEVIVAASSSGSGTKQYSVLDHYRFPGILTLLIVVIILAVIFAGWRGIGALFGLTISVIVIGGFVIPEILAGQNPYFIAIIGSFVIATVGIFFAHGFSRRTVLALISTYLTLSIAAVLSKLAVNMTSLNGIATEDVSYLHQQLPNINIQGLLLCGIIIGVLGVLDDITVGQAAAVEQLLKANPKLSWRELYFRGMAVGREHISSLMHTLILAYAGSAFIFIVYIAAVLNLPLWLSLNSELVIEEIARSLVGSLALILAVPVATLLSAYFLTHSPRQAIARLKRNTGRH